MAMLRLELSRSALDEVVELLDGYAKATAAVPCKNTFKHVGNAASSFVLA